MSRQVMLRSNAGDADAAPQQQGIAPGRRAMTQSLTSETATSTAERGFSGGGSEFPHKGAIESSFGRSLTATAHLDDNAHEACDTLGAKAYAFGDSVAFGASGTDLHTAAHEAAHTVQQQGGVQLKGGTSTDAYEQHADQVADLVVAGKSSGHMFSAGTASTGIQRKALQLKPDTSLGKAPAPVDVNGLPAKSGPPKQLNPQQQAFFNRTVEANSTVGTVGGNFSIWLKSMTIPYSQAWSAHTTALTNAQQAAKDANALVIGVIMAGAGGAVGGVVGDVFKNLGGGAAMVDGMKDLAKFGSRATGTGGLNKVLTTAQGFSAMPPNPLEWSMAVSLRVESEVLQPARVIVQGWQHSLNTDPEHFALDFDPVDAVNSTLRITIGGTALSSLVPQDQAPLAQAFERGFLNDWITSEAAKVFMHLSQFSWGKARDRLIQYGLSIQMTNVESVLNGAVDKGVLENNDRAIKGGHGLI